jgi:predicted transcriptional regulator
VKRLPMRKIREALRLSHEGLSTRVMALSLGVGRTTLREYLSRARDVGVSWPLPSELTDVELEHLLFPRRPAGNSEPLPLPD